MERLTPLAAAFLQAEDVDPDASLAIGSLAVFAGPAPAFEEFLDSIEGRLPLIPRYRQRLRRAFLDVAAPSWVDDTQFDVRRHVLRTVVPSPAGREEVAEAVNRVMTRRMDRSRPLWEYWFVEGLPDGRWGLLSKLHHSVVDGVSGTDLYRLVLDATPTPREPVPDTWSPHESGSRRNDATDALWSLVTTPVRVARKAASAPRALALTAAAATSGAFRLARAVLPVSATSLTGPLDGRRHYAWTTVSLADVRVARRAFDVTVNDVALAAVTGGFRRLLLSRGEEPTAHALRSLVPVSTRLPGEESIPDNRVTLMLPYLPVDVDDPVERLRAVHERIRALREGHEPEGGVGITTLAEYEPFPWVAWAVKLWLRFPQRQIATVTTNVPGPRTTLYALGCELEEILPYVPIADRVRIGVAIFSYRDALTFGLTADHGVEDLDVLAEGITRSLAELLTAAGAAVGRPARITESLRLGTDRGSIAT